MKVAGADDQRCEEHGVPMVTNAAMAATGLTAVWCPVCAERWQAEEDAEHED